MSEIDLRGIETGARTLGVPSNPERDASLNRAEFFYDYKVDINAINDGRPFGQCLKKKLFVKIATASTRDIACIPATEQEKALYASAYRAFMEKQQAEDGGTPISQVREFAPAQRDCYALRIFTIEQLAAEDPAKLSANSIGVYGLLAKRFLEKSAQIKDAPAPARGRGRPKRAVANANN